jgi:Flp pilus assembly protein TadG
MRAPCSLRKLLRFFHDRHPRYRRAGIALVVGLAAPVLVGASGFSVDAGCWFTQKSALQMATDAGAVKAARDLATNPATTQASLQSDALTAANAATSGQLNLAADDITISRLADPRQVQVTAKTQGPHYFSQVLYPMPVDIGTSSTAGVAYTQISKQAVCYSVDSYTYLYSTGFGTIDTSHDAGIDPFQCGSPPSPLSAYNAYCGGGVLGCSFNVLNAGGVLLPFAFQIGANGGAGGLSPVLGTVVQTLDNLTGIAAGTGAGPVSYTQGSAQCPGNSCTIYAGTYNGGITIGPNVTVTFAPSGANHDFLIENGNFTVSNQATLSAASDPNAVFFMGGANPGAYVAATQVQLNTAPINSGAILLTSTSTFQSSSIIGTQTSAPLYAMPYAQQSAETQGLLSVLGLPGQNLVGTNFESVVGICPQAVSNCQSPEISAAAFQSTPVPSLGLLSSLLPGLTLTNMLANEGESSSTTITSGVTFANGVPTNWSQQETASSTLTNTLQTVPNILKAMNISGGLAAVVTPLLQTVLNTIAPNESAQSNIADSGVFAGQTSVAAPSCNGQPVLFSQAIAPAFGPGFTDILQSAGESGASGAVSVTDNVTVCGQSPIASITPITPGTILTDSTAGGASSIELIK